MSEVVPEDEAPEVVRVDAGCDPIPREPEPKMPSNRSWIALMLFFYFIASINVLVLAAEAVQETKSGTEEQDGKVMVEDRKSVV